MSRSSNTDSALGEPTRGESLAPLCRRKDRRRRACVFILRTLCFGLMVQAVALLTAQSLNQITNLPQSCVELTTASREGSRLMQSAISRPSATVYHNLGESFADNNEFACSISAYELALKLDPHSWQTRQSLGLTLIQTGDLSRAARELRKVVRQQPKSHLAHNGSWLGFGRLRPVGTGSRGV